MKSVEDTKNDILTDALTVFYKDAVKYGFKKGYRKALEDCIELLNKRVEH